MDGYGLLKFLHLLAVVFMAAPLYNLIAVNERARFGPAHLQVDQYFENFIRSNALRCFVFQGTALATGVWLAVLADSWRALVLNPVLVLKLLILGALFALLSVVHLSVQPQIDRLLSQASGDTLPASLAGGLGVLRLRRKRLASICLFLVIAAVLLGLQVYQPLAVFTTAVLLGLAALFAWRVYRSGIPFGWL